MVESLRLLKSEVVKHFAQRALTSDDESRIGLFLQGIKTANAGILAKMEVLPVAWHVYRFLHVQYFKELEAATLLTRTVNWTVNPDVYADATRINLRLWQDADIPGHLLATGGPDRHFVTYLALSHALMAEIRFTPLFPMTWDYNLPFLSLIREIEDENGRQIQLQVRLLRDTDPSILPGDRERIVEEQRMIVLGVFAEFLQTLLPRTEGELEATHKTG